MKVKELIEKLSYLDPEAEVRVPVYFTHTTMGARPSVGIAERVYEGFDWDTGKVFIPLEVRSGYVPTIIPTEDWNTYRKKESDSIKKLLSEKGKSDK